MMMTTMLMMMMVPRGHVCPRVSNNRWPHRVSFVSLLYSVRYLFFFFFFLPADTPTSTFHAPGIKRIAYARGVRGVCVEGNK